jgi:hypothetical protein
MAECVVPGCAREALNNLGIRLRRPDTSAIWAPNSEAYVCDIHAESGARLTLYYEATEADQVEVRVHGAKSAAARTTPIQHREQEEALADDLTSRLSQ